MYATGAVSSPLVRKSSDITAVVLWNEMVADEEFRLQVPVIRLRRHVEMYQWVEEEGDTPQYCAFIVCFKTY